MDTHGLRINFGRHNGTLYTQVPVSYLKWMVQCHHRQAAIAQAELDRRGTHTPDLDVSGHALDRASQQCLDIWRRTRKSHYPYHPHEGLHAWLCRMAAEALEADRPDPRGGYLHQGMRFVFEPGAWPVLKTVMRVAGV